MPCRLQSCFLERMCATTHRTSKSIMGISSQLRLTPPTNGTSYKAASDCERNVITEDTRCLLSRLVCITTLRGITQHLHDGCKGYTQHAGHVQRVEGHMHLRRQVDLRQHLELACSRRPKCLAACRYDVATSGVQQMCHTERGNLQIASPIFICLIIHFRDGCSFNVISAVRITRCVCMVPGSWHRRRLKLVRLQHSMLCTWLPCPSDVNIQHNAQLVGASAEGGVLDPHNLDGGGAKGQRIEFAACHC
jgi:hypothetical protein